MGKRWGSNGRAPQQRRGLTRRRKSQRFDLRLDCYSKLQRLAAVQGEDGRPKSLIATLEELILRAPEPERLPLRATEFVRETTENG